MVLAESAVPDWRVVATDISSRALERTRHARYSDKEMSGVDVRRRDAHFTREGGQWRVNSSLRDRVAVSRLNLAVDPFPTDAG
jgi:chemotaxis methyl-accepting protein methylase